MIETIPKLMSFEDFLDWKPEESRYELHGGIIVEMQPSGKHEEINGFLPLEFALQIRQAQLPYLLPKQALVKPPDSETCYLPDVLIVNSNNLEAEPLWQKFSTLTQGASIPLIVEVVSTNWRDDYLKKLADYEAMGISEYWIVDYLGLGGRRFVGNPKQPTLSICRLVEGEYQIAQFRGSDRIESLVFPQLDLRVEQVFRI